MKTITTKRELKSVVAKHEPEFMVSGRLAKKLKPIEKVMKLSPAKILSLCAFATGAGATIIASLTASAVATPIAPAVIALKKLGEISILSASSGIEIALIVAFVVLCVIFGVTTIVALLKGYEVETAIDLSETNVVFRAKKQ